MRLGKEYIPARGVVLGLLALEKQRLGQSAAHDGILLRLDEIVLVKFLKQRLNLRLRILTRNRPFLRVLADGESRDKQQQTDDVCPTTHDSPFDWRGRVFPFPDSARRCG